MKTSLPSILSIICFSFTSAVFAQQTVESLSVVENLSGEATSNNIPSAGQDRAVNPGSANSTVVYEAEFFNQYNPITASDMLDRIPGIDISGRNRGGGGRGLGTGGNLLIDGQRIAGKDNSARDQLGRITAAEVERIEIIRDTSGELNVRGAGEVINIILIEVPSRSSTQAELLQRLNHDDTYEVGGSVGWSTQIGNFQGLLNLEARPNYENRDNREVRITPEGELLGTLFEENIRDQDKQSISTNMSYGFGAHRMQLNALFSRGDFPRSVRRDFVDFVDDVTVESIQQEQIDNEESNWELGGDYEYSFANGSRLAVLFVANDEIRNSVRERFLADPANDPLGKNLYIDSQRETKEFIVQTNYNFSVAAGQSLRVGFERAVNELDSSLFIASPFGTTPASEQYGGLSLIPSISNAGTQVKEERYEGFAFHNWTINDKSSLETSIVYETSEILQTGEVSKTRDFQFWRPSLDYRYNFADNFRFRGTVTRNVSQLSFSAFAATANEDDRDIDGFAGNPELAPETSWSYNGELEYRLPNDAGVLATSLFYSDIDNKLGKIIATIDPDQPQSATGNVGPATQIGWFARASIRLNKFNLPNAIFSGRVGLFDSEILNPFVNAKVRTGGRGFGNIGFRQDITSTNLSYGIDYNHSFWGGYYDIDIVTRTRDDRRRSLDLFVQKIWFDDWVFRLESDNTLGASKCRYRERYEGTTIEGNIKLIQDSCSSRYRRLVLSIQTTF
ncbi:TonB-dependent receptor [Gammaproteobacteria bacterium]|nr:TonB-dependent receptor [Gammaproteobacteria bacterium]